MTYKELLAYWYDVKGRYQEYTDKCKAENKRPIPFEQFKLIVKMERINNF